MQKIWAPSHLAASGDQNWSPGPGQLEAVFSRSLLACQCSQRGWCLPAQLLKFVQFTLNIIAIHLYYITFKYNSHSQGGSTTQWLRVQALEGDSFIHSFIAC